MGSILPDSEMHRWFRAGLRNKEVLQRLAEQGIVVGPGTVTAWKRRHGYDLKTSTPERLALIPWRVSVEHSSDPAYKALGAEARHRAGKDLDRSDHSRRAALIRTLSEGAEPETLVVHYDRVNGFVLVPARPGIDKDLIRDPRIADDGRPIPNPADWQ